MDKLSTSKKWELLGALYKNGCRKKRLLKDLEDWDENQIQKSIRSYRSRAQRNLHQNLGERESIDLWHDLIKNCHQIEETNINPVTGCHSTESGIECKNYSSLLSKTLMHAAAFEEHYQGSSPDDPNYNEIYRYLGMLLSGEEPIQLKPGNAKKIVDMMSKLKDLLASEDVKKYTNYISTEHNVSYLKPGVDVWSIVEEKRKKQSEAQSNVPLSVGEEESSNEEDPQYNKSFLKQQALASTILNIPGMNPLEMVLPSMVKSQNLIPTSAHNSRKRKYKSED